MLLIVQHLMDSSFWLGARVDAKCSHNYSLLLLTTPVILAPFQLHFHSAGPIHVQQCLAYMGSQVQHQENECLPTQSHTYDELLSHFTVGNHSGEGHSQPRQRIECSNMAYFDRNVV